MFDIPKIYYDNKSVLNKTKRNMDDSDIDDSQKFIGNTDKEKMLINVSMKTYRFNYAQLYGATNYIGPMEFMNNPINWAEVRTARFVVAMARIKLDESESNEYYLKFLRTFYPETEKEEIKRVLFLIDNPIN
jgi:hypothetical protein